MTDYEESYEQQLEGVGHPPTTVYRVSTHHAFQEHNGSSSSRSRSPSVGSHSVESSDSSIIQPAAGDASSRESQQAVRHWTYEEQFRQLYNVSTEPGRKEFLDKLFNFMQKKGTPITRIPIMAKQPLDLYKLFRLVVERGGLVEVIKKKAWRDIAKELSLPASITSAAFTMRSQYVKYLYPYECEYEHLSDPQELQTAIESNKRDRRHSENVTEFLTTQTVAREGDKLEQLMAGQSAATAFTVTGAPGLQLISSPTVAIPQASMPPYSGSFIITPSGVVATPRLSPHQLLQMTPPHLPIMVPTTQLQEVSGQQVTTTMIPLKPETVEEQRIESDVHILKRDSSSLLELERPAAKRVAEEKAESPSPQATGRLNMPFANISIKPAATRGSKDTSDSASSVLVTLELNNAVYQGVLFARPTCVGGTSSSTCSPTR